MGQIPGPLKESGLGEQIEVIRGINMLRNKTRCYFIAAVGVTLASLSAVLAQSAGQGPVYLNQKRPIEERIDELAA